MQFHFEGKVALKPKAWAEAEAEPISGGALN
jgi:hypothetical protein